MKGVTWRWLLWTVRILVIGLFIGVLSLFARENLRAGASPWELLASLAIIAVPVGASILALELLLSIADQEQRTGRMTVPARRLLYWAPRVLAMLFAGFVGLFAADVFDLGYGFWETVVALLIHLIPTGVLLLLLALAWRREWIGAIVFFLAALWFLVRFDFWADWQAYALFIGPLLVVSLLFLANWRLRGELHTGTHAA